MSTPESGRHYWLGLFNYSTWQTFLRHGGTVVGFREQRWLDVQRIAVGDYLLCYLTGISRWIGVLAVTEAAYFDITPIWPEDALPARLRVKPVVTLTPETALPLAELQDRLTVFNDLKKPKAWTSRLRRSLVQWPLGDGEAVVEALLDARLHPVVRTVDERKLNHRPRVFRSQATTLGEFVVTEPAANAYPPVNLSGFREPPAHTEIQWLLLKLGNDLGLDVWVARNDRGREFAGRRFASLARLLHELPRQFDTRTMRTVELIDVLWLQGGAIVAAFEIESTTTIYSGLLRMADLLVMQPNLNIPLYLVAPDERRAKVITEVNRPTFSHLRPPLNTVCAFIGFTRLRLRIQEAETMLAFLSPDFITDIAEPCTLDE